MMEKENVYDINDYSDTELYEILDLKKEDMTSLESYIKDYYQQILKRLKMLLNYYLITFVLFLKIEKKLLLRVV